MKIGDRVKLRTESKIWTRCGLEPDATGIVVEVYRDPEDRGGHKVDVRFPGKSEPELAIDAEELEVVA